MLYAFYVALILLLAIPQTGMAAPGSFATRKCPDEVENDFSIFVLPQTPVPQKPVRLVALSQTAQTYFSIQVFNNKNKRMKPDRDEKWGYIPSASSVYFNGLAKGDYKVVLRAPKQQNIKACFDLHVPAAPNVPANNESLFDSPTQAWRVTAEWNAAMEDLFSAFVARLFYVPRGASKGWRPMGRATQDPYRNILYGIKGLNEDNEAAEVPVVLRPDCADAPMQVRAYFAWKLGLPVLINECVRGSSTAGPGCYGQFSNETDNPKNITHPVARFNRFVKATVNWKTHAGVFRTLPDDDNSIAYPIELTPESIRPGVLFVDAGGHIIMVSQWEPQTEKEPGTLYGIDAHPDLTVSHKAFSKGTFIFNPRVPTDGFKAFRPVVHNGNELRFATNAELQTQLNIPQYSKAQSAITDADVFYSKVQKALNPVPINPVDMLQAKIAILHEAVKERIVAVQLGVNYMRKTHWETMSMPKGPAIFETFGPWEIYSTPARDMRLFLAIDDTITFPFQVRKNTDLYELPEGMTPAQVTEELNRILKETLSTKSVRYIRSDGSSQEVTLEDIVARQTALEMGYNPNDCPEVRWGAEPLSVERETCNHRAPDAQIEQMFEYRRWFIDRRRPDQR
ncbi:MAG: hypothetical protein JXR76_14600 [Deltaproteobacteria bacterium]|nr:hypothetical protein [Deltaproteobacteria bacterium]